MFKQYHIYIAECRTLNQKLAETYITYNMSIPRKIFKTGCRRKRILSRTSKLAAMWLMHKQTHSLPPPAAAALFFAKYSSARARFFATDGFTHFFRPGNAVSVQPTASNFSLAAAEKARAFTFTLTDKVPSPRI